MIEVGTSGFPGGAEVEEKDDQKTDDGETEGQSGLLVPVRGQHIGLGDDMDIPMTVDHGIQGLFPGPDFSERPQHEAGQNCQGWVTVTF